MVRAVVGTLLAVCVLAAAMQWWVMHPAPLAAPRDHCAGCHARLEGLEAGHASLSCAACHLGNTQTREEKLAHVGLVRIPGNVDDMDRTCGAVGCHADVPGRIRTNIMNTMNGVVSVDRWVFGEQPTPTARTPVAELGHSRADSHLRNLCASCHLGNPKTEPGPLTERSRGGGCNACHLSLPLPRGGEGRGEGLHASLRVLPNQIACFGCHSRSGRISLNAEGWQEFSGDAGNSELRTLEDGRIVRRGLGDLHTERGMGCVDCHGSWEVMGDGTRALHREQQSTLQCTDCHLTSAPRTLVDLDAESARIAKLEGFTQPGRRYLTIARSGVGLINTFVTDGGVFLTGKYSGRTVPMRAPTAACTKKSHEALSCGSCHEDWVPQCVSCHTRFEPDGGMFDLLANAQAPGDWEEVGGDPLADRASLGVRELDGGARRIEEFAPGMLMTLESSFHRLFAPVFAHTIRRQVRTCDECHADPLALGYGRGRLRYDAKARRWDFSPNHFFLEDGLPEDAWIGFLKTRGTDSTTRDDTRPFTVAEQQRVLAVGACLTCHTSDSAPMQQGLDDFAAVVRRMKPECSPR